jgi:hypothetical protein
MSPDLKQAGVLFFNPTFSFPRALSSREAGMDYFPFVIPSELLCGERGIPMMVLM